jgi:hypothetical protein
MRPSQIPVMPRLLAISTTIVVTVSPMMAIAADGAAKIEPTVREITAADLAPALGVRWWSYRLRFDKPVYAVRVQPCELRRKPDGTWQREALGPSHQESSNKKIREIEVTLFIPEASEGKRYALKMDGTFMRNDFKTPPDFDGMYSKPGEARMIAGCLILAYREKEPNTSTGQEENMTRLFGLHVETKG